MRRSEPGESEVARRGAWAQPVSRCCASLKSPQYADSEREAHTAQGPPRSIWPRCATLSSAGSGGVRYRTDARIVRPARAQANPASASNQGLSDSRNQRLPCAFRVAVHAKLTACRDYFLVFNGLENSVAKPQLLSASRQQAMSSSIVPPLTPTPPRKAPFSTIGRPPATMQIRESVCWRP